jgi:hypothetical protein
MLRWLDGNHAEIRAWAVLIGVPVVIYWLSFGTQYHQLGIGILAASVILLAVTLLFEALWRLILMMIGFLGRNPKL